MRRTILNGVWSFICHIFGIAFSLAIILVSVYAVYHYTTKALDKGKAFTQEYTAEKPYKEVTVQLDDGDTLDDVADILYDDGVITSTLLFKLEAILQNDDEEEFTAGTFVVNTDMDTNQLFNALHDTIVQSQDVRLTVLEGYTMRDIGDLLESEEIVTADEFYQACEDEDYGYPFLDGIPEDRENHLEGYLFPDTYMIAENSTPEMIIDKMVERFGDIYTPVYATRAEELDLTTDQIVTIASIIEKEVSVAEERALVSSVIQNRLAAGMNLEMDSTVVYALDKRKDRLTYDDLQVDSPYNTYLYPGLPVGPISNPGQACLEAALYPADTDYLYYVLKDDGTGEHFFTNDYDEFLSAKELYTASLDNTENPEADTEPAE